MINCNVGEMRHRVTFQSLSRTRDASGQKVLGGYVDVVTVWARIKTASIHEAKRGQQVESQASHVLTIRHREGLDSTMVVKFGSRRFNIIGIINVDELDIQNDVYCTEVTAAGILQATIQVVGIADTNSVSMSFTGNKMIDQSNLPDVSAFQVTDGGGTINPTSVTVDGNVIVFGFARDIGDGATWAVTDATEFEFIPPAKLVAPLSGNVSLE